MKDYKGIIDKNILTKLEIIKMEQCKIAKYI